ncbi:MAG: hypothetical protein I8H68_08495 [Flavobacteriia bacterium]|nr:hypothetical protein [Flavobacteriia bacterium]MBH2023780.1 hypothetical protein [Flavobacteriales bacterium]
MKLLFYSTNDDIRQSSRSQCLAIETVVKVVSLVFILFSILTFSQVNIPNSYTKIPDSLHFSDNLYQSIIPNKNYDYWKVINYDTSEEVIIYESNKMKNCVGKLFPKKGFFNECAPSACFSYIIAYQNKKPEYFTDENELRNFIGYIDNLSEALLIAKTYDLGVDRKSPIGGSFKIEKDFIYLYLARFENCPVSREAFFVTIRRKTGKFEYESQGIYYQTQDCYSS